MTPGSPRWSGVVSAVALAAAVGGCVSPPADQDASSPIVFARDFQGFEAWSHETLVSDSASGSTHVAGTRTVYINHRPAPGATTYPEGTVIVKRTEADGKLFARAKRGGTFNSTGAVGWEWFELGETDAHDVVIQWRGLGPPLGEKYGGNAAEGCNPCHKIAAMNDFVLTPGLQLAGAVAVPTDGGADTTDADTSETTTTHE